MGGRGTYRRRIFCLPLPMGCWNQAKAILIRVARWPRMEILMWLQRLTWDCSSRGRRTDEEDLEGRMQCMQIKCHCSSSTSGSTYLPWCSRSRCGAPGSGSGSGWMQDDMDRLEGKLVVFSSIHSTQTQAGHQSDW